MDLFDTLDREWERWRSSPATATAFSRWAAAEPAVAAADGLEGLLVLFDRPAPGSHQRRDEVLLALVRLARSDADAHRLLLHVLRAGLLSLSTRAHAWGGGDEAASLVAVAAVEQIRRYPLRRSTKVAANLLGDVWHAVWTARQADLWRQARCRLVETDELVDVPDESEPHAVEEILAAVDEALARGRISRRDARLVALHRAFGLTNPEVAALEGCRPCTVRKRRAVAEAAIIELAVA